MNKNKKENRNDNEWPTLEPSINTLNYHIVVGIIKAKDEREPLSNTWGRLIFNQSECKNLHPAYSDWNSSHNFSTLKNFWQE